MAAAPPLALWGALIFLFVTNGVTLYALTGLNVRYDQLQTDCSAELSERDLLLQTASTQADSTDKTIETCHNTTRQAAVMGSIWLTVAVEASKNAQAKLQLRGYLSTLMFEAPMRSLSGVELRLFNIVGASKMAISDLDDVHGIAAWRKSGRLSTFPTLPSFANTAKLPLEPSGAIPGGTVPDVEAEERTINFASMLTQLDGTCQHVLLLEMGSGAQLCPSSIHLIRNIISRADSFWGAWSGIRLSHGVNGLTMPCAHLTALSDFLLSMRKAATLPQLLEVWLSKDVNQFPVLKKFEERQGRGSVLIARYNLIMFNAKSLCGAPFQVEGALTAQKGFDGQTCGHNDFSPCLGDFGEPWLRYEGGGTSDKEVVVLGAGKNSGSGPNEATSARIRHSALASHQYLVGGPRGKNCDKACEEEGLSCLTDSAEYNKINNCDTLTQVFGQACKKCENNEGNEQPALDVDAGQCLVKTDHSVFHCDSKHAKTRRLCVCQ